MNIKARRYVGQKTKDREEMPRRLLIKNKKTVLKFIDIDRRHIQLIDNYVLERIKCEA